MIPPRQHGAVPRQYGGVQIVQQGQPLHLLQDLVPVGVGPLAGADDDRLFQLGRPAPVRQDRRLRLLPDLPLRFGQVLAHIFACLHRRRHGLTSQAPKTLMGEFFSHAPAAGVFRPRRRNFFGAGGGPSP